MKKKFLVEIHANGSVNESILRMITNHNEGKANIDLALIRRRVECYRAEWASIASDFNTRENVTSHSLDIWEGEKHTMTITQKTVVVAEPETN